MRQEDGNQNCARTVDAIVDRHAQKEGDGYEHSKSKIHDSSKIMYLPFLFVNRTP